MNIRMKLINSMKSRELGMLIVAFLFSLLLLSSCGSQPEAASTPTPAVAEQDVEKAILDATGLEIVPTLAQISPTRTPEPTATPDALTQDITQAVEETGLAGKTFLWLDIVDWINLGISLLIVLLSYLLGTWVIHGLLPRLVSRTKTDLDERLLQSSGDQLRWLVVAVILRFATNRLTFGVPAIKAVIDDICFFLIVFIIAWMLWRLINLIAQQANARASKTGHQKEAESLIKLMIWGLRSLVVILVLMVILIHYGINVTGFTLILGAIAFALSLAGRDILADVISGAIILMDQPYRIGDRLDLAFLDSWGDVVDIGMRSTKILSVENRMVVVPNSQIGKIQVVNYSYPDPSYYNFMDVFVAYDSDPDQVAEIIVEAIRSVEGVQLDREVLALLYKFDQFSMVYWACWWVANYVDRYPVQDKVSRAIVRDLKKAGIVLPYQKGSLSVQVKPDGSTTVAPPAPKA